LGIPAPGKRDTLWMDNGIEISAGCSTLILIRAVEHAVNIKRRMGNLKSEKRLAFMGFDKGNHRLSQMIS
jgi:hypothetical protein